MHIKYHLIKWAGNMSLVIHWEITAHLMYSNIDISTWCLTKSCLKYNRSFLIYLHMHHPYSKYGITIKTNCFWSSDVLLLQQAYCVYYKFWVWWSACYVFCVSTKLPLLKVILIQMSSYIYIWTFLHWYWFSLTQYKYRTSSDHHGVNTKHF